MERNIERILLVILIGGTLLTSRISAAVENMILNGDFEQGPAEWNVAARPPAAMKMVIDAKEAVSGDVSARLEIDNLGNRGTHDLTLDSQSQINIKKGKTYTVDFWIKAEEDRTITIDFLMNHDPWTRQFQVERIPVTTDWAVQFHTFEATLSDPNMIFLFSFSKASNVNAKVTTWIDNVRFYEGEFDEQNLSGETPRAVSARDKVALTWASLKRR